MGLKAGATVAHLSFYLAEFLGCDPIILIGQDLGFVDGLYYKPGTAIHETWGVELGRFNTLETKEWERIVRSRRSCGKSPTSTAIRCTPRNSFSSTSSSSSATSPPAAAA